MKAQVDPTTLTPKCRAAVLAYVPVTVSIFALVKLARLDGSTYLHRYILGNTGNLVLPLVPFAFWEEVLAARRSNFR